MKKTSNTTPSNKESKTTKDKGLVKSVVKTGLPPGISITQAKDPGAASASKGFKNNS